MKNVIFGILSFFFLTISISADAQEDVTRFPFSDFKQLHQMEGNWKGMAGNSPFFEGYVVKNDTLIEITYFSDATLSESTGSGNVYFSNGNIYHSNGKSVWRLKKKEANTFFFEPARNAGNSFSWILTSPDTWTAEVGSPGRSKSYKMKKVN